MSKYKEITTQIADRDHITAALSDLGVAGEVAPAGQALALNGWGRQGKTAEIVVRKETLERSGAVRYLYGDFGWIRDTQTGAYRLIVDDIDAEQSAVRSIVEGVAQRCAFYRLQELAAQNGFAAEALTEFDVQRVFVG